MHYQAATLLSALSQGQILSFSSLLLSSNQHEVTEKVINTIFYWQMDIAFTVVQLIS